MASTRFYLDRRSPRSDGTYPLKISLSKGSNTRHFHLGVFLRPEEWDSRSLRVVGRSDKAYLNTYISQRKQEVDRTLLRIIESGEGRHLTVLELRDRIAKELSPEEDTHIGVSSHLRTFADRHTGRTRELYLATLRHLEKFLGRDLPRLTFEEVDKAWLTAFDEYLSRSSPSRNARNIHLRNLRAVFNDAIDADLTTSYPFRRFPIRAEETPKRSLSAEQLRTLFSYPCEEWRRRYIDLLELMFLLVGINVVDLYSLQEVVNGRVEYYRRKTRKFYSIKVEPEAMAIIERYKGETSLLDIADRCANYRSFAMRLNLAVQHVGTPPLFPHITTYWMRHSWASIAAELDVPDDTISRALGHSQTSGARVTQVYINFNARKIDEANRRVIDYVLYGKT